MFVRLLVLWIYLVVTSLHMVGAFATSLNGCRETPAQVRVLSAEVDLRFEYDALGRRVAKINEYGKAENHKITRFLWDGNVPLHEWSYPLSERPETVDDSDGRRSYASPEPQTELTTWIFDEGTFVPSAKLVGERRYSIISDYLGTPVEAYDEEGKRVWARESWTSMGGHAQRSERRASSPSSTKGSTSIRRLGSPTTASDTTRQKQGRTSVKTQFVSKQG